MVIKASKAARCLGGSILEAQVALQSEKIEKLEEEQNYDDAIFDDSMIYGGWWIPHHPAFVYGQLLPHQFPHRFHHKQQSVVPPQAGLRGNLQSRRGGVSINLGTRPLPR